MTEFLELYEQYKQELFHFIVARVGNADDAEDLLSETFITAMRYVERGGAVTHGRGLLYTIARQRIIVKYRERGRTISFTAIEKQWDTEDGGSYGGSIPDTDPLPDAQAGVALQLESLKEALGDLPVKYREIIQLHYLDQLSISEIATTLEKTEGAVRVQLHRAVERLTTILAWYDKKRSDN